MLVELSTETGGGKHWQDEEDDADTNSFSYTLAEEGSDAISVDVYDFDNYSPIFRTRAGQTSNPYEGEVRTEFYEENGTHPVIMEATMQIEVPTISVDWADVSDVPTGAAANYTIHLGNQSEVGADVAYKLFVIDETNPDGAQISIDGMVLTEGRLIKVPGNQSLTKTLQLRQTNAGILDYFGNANPNSDLYQKGIGIVFASESQPEDIADTIFITARFIPSSSPVTLALSTTTMNTSTGTKLTLTIKDFDRNYVGLKAFRLQYKKPGDTDWIQLHEYVLNQSDLDQSGGNELLPSGGSVSYLKDLASFTDGSYQFRVVSAATYGLEEVYRYSDELTFVKDTQKPRPIGTPEPADGVLDIGDELSVTFNETILKDLLTKINNFKVTGVLNGAEIAHETALNLDGGSSTVVAAQTEADINLANKDFSIDTWVNITGAGTLLSHGKGSNKLTVSTDDNNKLVVNIAGNSYTSLNSVPTDDWAFLSMNVTADGKLNATAATANETVNLFADELVAPYTGNGPLSVGCGSDAALHELLLWDEAHDMTTALMNRSKTKNPSTRHLIGYWKMDEGEGKEIRDYSRNRNMTMPNETWYLNNENKAVTLDGENYVSITTAALNLFKGDDYAVEFWMRGGEQTGEAQLMQMGDVALWTSADGDLMLTGKEASLGAAQQTSNLKTQASNLLDNAWHHIALNVLRQGAAAVYVDGKRCLTTSSANMGDINGDKMIVGARRISNYENGESTPASYTFDRVFKGTVDEIRVWGATMNGDQLSKNRKVRFTGSEPGLIAYYPFETKTTDEYHQEVTNGTPEDLTGSGLQAQLLTVNAQLSAFSYSDDAPALRTKPTETNVNFTYTASDNKIVIELDEDAATIEGCTLNFTVRDLSDVNGNYSMPAVWSAFVNRKELVWAEDVLSVEQSMNTGSSVTATLVNKGGKQQMWTLSGLPSWMTADSEYGQANPLEEKTVTLNILPTAPLGRHEVTIYVTGNDNINVPLTLNVKVTGEEPLWTVNAGDYEETMNVFGSLMIVDVPSQDEDDIIGAFVNNECRGVSHLTYNKRYDGYFMMMDIYGNGSDANKDVVFKVYDASTGTIYPVVNTYATLTPEPESVNIKFVSNNLWGTLKDPVFLCATDTIEQNIELGKGWNWISFSVKPKVMTTNTVFANADGLVTIIKSQAKNDQYYESYGAWYINMALNNREMYALYATEPFTLSVTGQRVNPADEPISFNKNWNWIGYNGQRVISLSEALTGMSPVTGDLIKGQRGVAYYDEYEWVGSMGTLKPGQGYKAKNTTSESRTFTYPPSAANITAVHQARRTFDDETATPRVFHPVDYRNYPANMVLIARVVRNGMPLADAELGVFAGSECREAVVTDGQGMVYITIPGDAATKLTFRVAADGEVFNCSESLNYETDAVVGTPRAPFVIDLAQATGITELDYRTISTSDNCYDLQGRRIDSSTFNVQRSTLKKGVYIINGQKQVK